MNKDLGEKQKRIRISLGLVMPLLYPVIGLLMLGFVVFRHRGGRHFYPVTSAFSY